MRLATHNPSISVSASADLSMDTFNAFRTLIYDHSGISLGVHKQSLLKGRIQRRMRNLGFASFEDYLRHVTEDHSGQELQLLIDAISTNVTSFYREKHHFEFMRGLIPVWISEGKRKLRIWSSACSSGEEPYTIAIETLESAGQSTIDAKILATDISTKMLEACQLGQYSARSLETVPPALRSKYFTATGSPKAPTFEVSRKLSQMLTVKQFNLTSYPYKLSGPIDLIFCRNVMIYFDRTTREKIIHEFSKLIPSGGFLFVGHSESLNSLTDRFACVRPSIYRRL